MLKHWVERCKKFSKCVCSENKISNSNKNIFSQTIKNQNIDNFETGSYKLFTKWECKAISQIFFF